MANVSSPDISSAHPRRLTPAGRLLGVLLSRRLVVLWILVTTTLVLFTAFRAGLVLASLDALKNVTIAQIATCFLIGLRYDIVPVGYIVLPVLVLLGLAKRETLAKKWFRMTVTVYASLAIMLLLAGEIVGAAFYLHFGSRLNWLALDHLGSFAEPFAYIQDTYPVWSAAAAWMVVLGLLMVIFARIVRPGRLPCQPAWRRPIHTAVLVCAALLACRGSIGPMPLRFGPANFSQNRALTQLTLNNLFTLTSAARAVATDSDDEREFYDLPSPEQARRVVADMILQPGEELTDTRLASLWRKVETARPASNYNVVVIIMEGMAGEPVGIQGNRPSHTPALDQLATESLYFERMYAVGTRTSHGMAGILCGHPDLRGRALIKRPGSQGTFLTLPGVFARRGYETLFIYGGDPDFDNMRGFFSAGGVDTFIGLAEMGGPAAAGGNWGVHDETLFRKAHETFVSMGDRKFFASILTVSNHEPFTVPSGRTELLPATTIENRKINAYRYADWALGDFFRMARKAEYFHKTVFVLVSDHGRGEDTSVAMDVLTHNIPCLIYAPSIVAPGRVETVCSQTDIAPTVLSLLGGRYECPFMGRDVLSVEPGEGFAVMRADNRMAIVRGDKALCVRIDGQPVLYHLGHDRQSQAPSGRQGRELASRLELQLLSYHELATWAYLAVASHAPPLHKPSVIPHADG